jgi:hypothetical protein
MARKKLMKEQGYCTKPDRDAPELICGYPLPCPYHTVVIELAEDPPIAKVPLTVAKEIDKPTLDKLKRAAAVLREEFVD